MLCEKCAQYGLYWRCSYAVNQAAQRTVTQHRKARKSGRTRRVFRVSIRKPAFAQKRDGTSAAIADRHTPYLWRPRNLKRRSQRRRMLPRASDQALSAISD